MIVESIKHSYEVNDLKALTIYKHQTDHAQASSLPAKTGAKS